MAYEDDLLNAAQKRTRTGRSFFPAANYSQGQTIIPSRYGTSSAVLPPDQNPAYQAAISNNPTPASRYAAAKSGTSAYTWIQTPSHGYMNVPTGSVDRITSALTGSNPSVPAPAITPINYGSQVGFSMLGNVPSAPTVPPAVARPYEAPSAPFTPLEQVGSAARSAINLPGRGVELAAHGVAQAGRAAFGLGNALYRGFTGQRTPQPIQSELGAGATAIRNPMTPNPWGNDFWNRGLPTRFSDVQPNDYFSGQ